MRVIAGELKGRRLESLKGENTRPTLDRVKESMFNILQNSICGSCVLDLFCGSGALGIEALSRGAGAAYFFDSQRDALEIAKTNIERCGLKDRCFVFNYDHIQALRYIESKGIQFDLIFLDPPFENQFIEDCVKKCLNLLSQHGIITIEHNINNRFGENLFNIIGQKRYGKIGLTFIKK